MLHYFYLLNRPWWECRLRPALADGWRRRSFTPCQELCRELSDRQALPDDAVIRLVAAGLPFDRTLWHALIDECLIHGAVAMPRLSCAVEALRLLLNAPSGPTSLGSQADSCHIDLVYFGSRDLRLGGGWHRPDHVGWNDHEDVARLTDYLDGIDPRDWTTAALIQLDELPDEAERTDELAYLCDLWPDLVAMYRQARTNDQIIICERT